MTTTPTPEAPREAVAAAIEAKLSDLVVSVGASFRNHLPSIPDPLLETLARTAVAVFASTFGSDVTDAEIEDAAEEGAAASTAIVQSLFPTLAGHQITAWIVSIDVAGEGIQGHGFGMLTDRDPDFMHQALAHEALTRVTTARRAMGV